MKSIRLFREVTVLKRLKTSATERKNAIFKQVCRFPTKENKARAGRKSYS